MAIIWFRCFNSNSDPEEVKCDYYIDMVFKNLSYFDIKSLFDRTSILYRTRQPPHKQLNVQMIQSYTALSGGEMLGQGQDSYVKTMHFNRKGCG